MARFMDWDAPSNASKLADWTRFLTALANSMANAPSAYLQWTPALIEQWFESMELTFYQKRQRYWAFNEVPLSQWKNIYPIFNLLGNEVLPLLHKVDPTAKIVINNVYRTSKENENVDSKSDSLHRNFCAVDCHASKGQLFPVLKYIVDRLYALGSRSMPRIGYGIYDGGWIHIDTRVGRSGKRYSWFNSGIKRKFSGVISYSDQAAGLQVSPIPPLAAGLALTPPSGAVVASGDGAGAGDGLDDNILISNSNPQVVLDDGTYGSTEISGVGLAEYLTPEEVIMGIKPEFINLEDWHLNQLIGDKSLLDRGLDAVTETAKRSAARVAAALEEQAPDSVAKSAFGALRADLGDDSRRRYVMSLADLEFWRRRWQARSMPQVSSHFNPHVVSGFPGLIMNPDRPIIAMVTGINHEIDVGGPSARTTTSFGAPRYWDEGEPWHFLGGWGESDHGAEGVTFHRYLRRFPYWHNQLAMPTNNFTKPDLKVRRDTPLDRFYMHMIGCKAIDYQSNHAFVFRRPDESYDYARMASAIKERDTSGLDVNPATLEIREFNRMIAELDDKGRYAKHTLAYKLWGNLSPDEPPERLAERESADRHYTERYGIKEKELFVEFLGNRAVRWRKKRFLVITGPTFGGGGTGKNAISKRQQAVIDYIEDIESNRNLGGGTE